MGMCDGLSYSLNTKAALLTYALEEISQLIKVAGGKKHTAYELAGLGDLIGTSLCPDSRNRLFGEYLGKGIKSSLKNNLCLHQCQLEIPEEFLKSLSAHKF
jgi:glycerol-3-phosphate dehydrogenase (NAD(P)+)